MILKFLIAYFLSAASVYAFADARFTVSANGQEVADSKTGLIWRRCAEGMTASVNGCAGAASTYSHQAAQILTTTQSGWRLPNVKELYSIVNQSHQDPTIDSVAFPATPVAIFWSSSPVVIFEQAAWGVVFSSGLVNNYYRHNTLYVRLVRTAE